MVTTFDPSLLFVILGDIDRFGHADLTGTTLKVSRPLALADTDQQVKRFVDHLKATGKWAHSIVIVLADHSMDWSLPHQFISLSARSRTTRSWPARSDRPERWRRTALLARRRVAEGDGDQEDDRDRRGHHRRPGSPRPGRDPGVAARTERGRRDRLLQGRVTVHRPVADLNPIPGNHGAPATQADPFFVSGGHPVCRGEALVRARHHGGRGSLGRFFQLSAPRGRWDGISRL